MTHVPKKVGTSPRALPLPQQGEDFDIAPPLEGRLLLAPATFMAAPRYLSLGYATNPYESTPPGIRLPKPPPTTEKPVVPRRAVHFTIEGSVVDTSSRTYFARYRGHILAYRD